MIFNGLAFRRPSPPPVRSDLAQFSGLAFDLALIDHQSIFPSRLLEAVLVQMDEDLLAFQERDPASRGKPRACLLSRHSTFFAVACHRLAHALIASAPDDSDDAVVAAMRLSFCARTHTGVEIHPEASIGARLVIDHGFGTVIGQTVEIGDDCYILNGVTLGGRMIGDARDGKRHPTIGHRVQIAGNAKVLGPVRIGDDCVIGPDATVTRDLPAGARVLVRRDQALEFDRPAPRSHLGPLGLAGDGVKPLREARA
jgi:serine O-acetyltransferase